MKDFPKYEGLYSVSRDGRVWSYRKEKWLIPGTTIHGYRYVILCSDKTHKSFTIHRMVATTYKKNPKNHPVVQHLDNNKLNNNDWNLEWTTHSVNLQQAHDDGLCPTTEKIRKASRENGIKRSKKVMQLTKEGILCRVYNSCNEAMRITSLNSGNISLCATGKRPHVGGFIWKYS